MSTTKISASTAEEEAVFDRQMRLWGADAQKRLRAARVLFSGRFNGFASELAKNLVLAGVNVSLLDDETEGKVIEEDVLTNIFLRKEDVGSASRTSPALDRLQEMNPFASVKLIKGDDKLKVNLNDFVGIVSINESLSDETTYEFMKDCRSKQVPLILCQCNGMFLVSLLDVGQNYSFVIEGKSEANNASSVGQVSFPPLHDVVTFTNWSTLPIGRKAFPDPLLGFLGFLQFQQQNKSNDNGDKIGNSSEQNDDENSPTKSKKVKLAVVLKDFIEEEFIPKLPEKSFKDKDQILRAALIFENGSSFAPINTIGGGLIGQEVLKLVTGQSEPIKNIILIDGKDGSAVVRSLLA